MHLFGTYFLFWGTSLLRFDMQNLIKVCHKDNGEYWLPANAKFIAVCLTISAQPKKCIKLSSTQYSAQCLGQLKFKEYKFPAQASLGLHKSSLLDRDGGEVESVEKWKFSALNEHRWVISQHCGCQTLSLVPCPLSLIPIPYTVSFILRCSCSIHHRGCTISLTMLNQLFIEVASVFLRIFFPHPASWRSQFKAARKNS